jgi:hypothetical protein
VDHLAEEAKEHLVVAPPQVEARVVVDPVVVPVVVVDAVLPDVASSITEAAIV